MPTRNFRFRKQKGNACGIACAAMIAGVSIKKAKESAPYTKSVGLNLAEILSIVRNNCNDIKIQKSSKYVIPNLFRSKAQFRKFFEKTTIELNSSLLICIVYNAEEDKEPEEHWLIYDVEDNTIKDPDEESPMSVREFVNGYYKVTDLIDIHPIT